MWLLVYKTGISSYNSPALFIIVSILKLNNNNVNIIFKNLHLEVLFVKMKWYNQGQ